MEMLAGSWLNGDGLRARGRAFHRTPAEWHDQYCLMAACTVMAGLQLLLGWTVFLTVSSFLDCRVHLAPLVLPAKMALMESLAPLGLLVPVDVQAKQALL